MRVHVGASGDWTGTLVTLPPPGWPKTAKLLKIVDIVARGGYVCVVHTCFKPSTKPDPSPQEAELTAMVSQLHARNFKLENELRRTQADLAAIQQAVLSVNRDLVEHCVPPSPLTRPLMPLRYTQPVSQHVTLSDLLATIPVDRSPSFSSTASTVASQHSSVTQEDVTLDQLHAALLAASMLRK